MHIELETLPNCVTNLRVELPPDRVSVERQSIVKDFQGAARLPGYRVGKAPRTLVETRYRREILEELQRKLVATATREAIAEKKLRVLSVGNPNQVELGKDDTLRFTTRVITAPEFELPTYRGLAVKVPPAEVTEADIDRALDSLRQRMADFNDIEGRGLQMDDFSVIDFAARLDGQPLGEAVPDAPKELAGKEKFWIKLGPQTLLPGFSEALLGATAGETRDFTLAVPEDFPIDSLRGKTLEYTVKVLELKEQALPPLDDAFAEKVVPGKTLALLREVAREQLATERVTMIDDAKRRQILNQLTATADFELPNEFVRGETQRIMGDIVKQNQERGVSDEEIRTNEKDIVANADQAARERLKGAFILTRIAEQEGIKVTRAEMDERLLNLAARNGMSHEKLLKTLEDREAFGQVEEEILLGKTLAFLSANASVETVTSPAPSLAETEVETPSEPTTL